MFKINLRFTVERDGQPFADFDINYANVDEKSLVLIEGKVLGALNELQAEGVKKANS